MAVPTYIVKKPTVGGLRNPRNPGAGVVPAGAGAKPTPRPQIFRWDWNQLDPQAETDLARARQSLMQRTGLMAGMGADGKPTFNHTGTGSADAELQRALHMTAAQRIAAQQSADQGEQAADNNATARGVFNSGIRLMNRGRVNADLSSQMGNLAAQDTSAQEAWQRAVDEATSNFIMDRQTIGTNASTRAWQAFRRRYPNAVRGA